MTGSAAARPDQPRPAQPGADQPGADRPRLALAGRRVLLIEDEFLVAAMLADMLEDAGAEVLGPAASLAEGLRLAQAGGFDVAVLDWNLDGRRSDPIARALVAAGLPFLIATGYGAVGDEFAAVPLIGKPYDPAAVIARLAALVPAA